MEGIDRGLRKSVDWTLVLLYLALVAIGWLNVYASVHSSDMQGPLDFAVRSGKGYLEITSGKDANVRISNLGGMLIDKEQMMAGETRIVNVPAGVYIVNGVKIIVK